MAITKAEATAQGVITDNPELLTILKDALGQFLVAAHAHGFVAPIDFTIRDADGDTLREFRVEPDGKAVAGRTDAEEKLFFVPLTIFAVDANGRVARMKIDATQMVEPVEFLN